MRLLRSLFSMLILTVAGPAAAQSPYLVDDINTTIDPAAGTKPSELTPSGASLYFVGEDDANGLELHRSDGTAPGTRLVMDLVPWAPSPRPTELTASAGGVFFVQDDPFVQGLELWRSDGTAAGTSFVAELEPAGSLRLTSVGPLVFFRAMNAGSPALWRSDGTPSGTFVVRTGPIDDLTAVGDSLFFNLSDAAIGRELWKSDGTIAGTVLVRDICPGSCSGDPDDMAAVGDVLFFAATEPATGRELWKSDGTTAGTALVRDLNPGTPNTSMAWLTNVAGTLFFGAATGTESGLWKSDGTMAGTVLVHPVSASNLTAVGTNVFFLGYEPATGAELWVSNGTTAGTHLVADVCPGPCNVLPYVGPGGGALMGTANLMFFSRYRAPGVWELWRSDGTPGGTFAVLAWAEIGELASFAGELFFAGDDGASGLELWHTDGTAAGTAPLTARAYDSSYPRSPITVGERLFFTADEPAVGTELWSTAGTPSSTSPLDLMPGPYTSSPYAGTAVGDRLLFAARTDPASWGIWSTDGTIAGSRHLLDASGVRFHPASRVAGVAVLGAGLASDSSGTEPWRSDGTTAGTSMIKDLVPGGAGSGPEFVATRGDTLFFTANTPSANGGGLWRTDGTPDGTTMVKSGLVVSPAMLRETLFAARFESDTGVELWTSDGTASGTRLVKDIAPGTASSSPHFATAAGNLVFFVTSSDPVFGGNLWRSDGTDAGTYQIKDFAPGPASFSNPFHLTELNGLLYFVADDGVHGRELWRSDGTTVGTWMVKDIWPGPGSALSDDDFTPPIVAAGGLLLLSAYTPQTGIEPWLSDGTDAGTVPAGEISPGPRSSQPLLLGSAGPRAYFTAHDGTHGWELWAVDLPPALSVQDVWVVEGDAGTKDAAFEVRLSKAAGQTVTVAYATADGSATASGDYLPRAGTLTFAPGSVGPFLVSVPIVGDLQDEPDESVLLNLTPGLGAALADGQAVAVVVDDDAPALQVADVTVTEGDSGAVNADFVVTITTPDGSATASAKTVAFATEGLTAAAPSDFTATTGSLTFAAGTPSGGTGIVRVTVNGDTIDEPDEAFRVRLTSTSDVTVPIPTATGTILDDDGPTSSPPLELAHGVSLRADLASAPGADRDWYLLRQQRHSSYEIVADEVSGDVGPLQLRRWAADGTTVVQSGVPTGSGPNVSLRWENTADTAVEDEHVSVDSGGCGTDCGADDTYRVRAYETTLSIPRLNTTGGQSTFVILQNRSDHAISGHVWLWSPSGYLWSNWTEAFTLGPRAVQVLQPLAGVPAAGSMTVTHDGGLGELAGKAVSVDPAAGFSFDTPLEPRKR